VALGGALFTIAYVSRAWNRGFWGVQSPAVEGATADRRQVAILVAVASAVVLLGVGFQPVYEFAGHAADAALDRAQYVDTVLPDGGALETEGVVTDAGPSLDTRRIHARRVVAVRPRRPLHAGAHRTGTARRPRARVPGRRGLPAALPRSDRPGSGREGDPYGLLYAAAFLYDLLTANVDVARRVLAPSMPIEPRVIEVPLRVETPFAITTIANSITLTPGTLSMDYDDETNTLYVHAIDGREPEAVVDPIRRWEDYALVIFDEERKPGDPVPSPGSPTRATG